MQVIRHPIRYMFQLFAILPNADFLFSTPQRWNRSKKIFAYSYENYQNMLNYWTETFHASFNNINQANIQIFFDSFLTQVETEERLLSEENTFWIDTNVNMFYIHLSRYWWRRILDLAYIYQSGESTFTSAPKNFNNPSDNIYTSGTTEYIAKTTFNIPSLEQSLSDVIAGISLQNEYSINLNNVDGSWDSESITKYFNTPCTISKSIKETIKEFNDFKIIRQGVIKSTNINLDNVNIKIADTTFGFSKSFCKKFRDYIDLFSDIDEGILDDDVPAGYGQLYSVPLISISEINENQYVAIDKDFIIQIDNVYDEDGNTITFNFNSNNGVITATQIDTETGQIIKASSADVKCIGTGLIADIIKDVLIRNEQIIYIPENFDVTEWDYYASICPEVGIYIESMTTNDIIEECLKSDNAFLIQKNNGRLTLRRWGVKYNSFLIDNWVLTSVIEKSYEEAVANYCSTIEINYHYNINQERTAKKYINDSIEQTRYQQYKKSRIASFNTYLLNESDALDLGQRLLTRFGYLKETVKIAVGVDTFNVNLLDFVGIDLKINDRQFSSNKTWIVKAIDPAQDTLTLEAFTDEEALYYNLTYDEIFAEADTVELAVNN